MATDEDLADQIVEAVRAWIDKDVIGHADTFEHADEFPQAMFDQMCAFGLFGATIPTEYGGLGLDATTYFEHIAKPETKAWLRANTQELIERGGFGSPTMFVNGDDMYFGNDRLPLVGAALKA